jgi:signal peptidase I
MESLSIALVLIGLTIILVGLINPLCSLFLTLKILKINKPRFLVWLGIIFALSLATSILGTIIGTISAILAPGIPSWVGISAISLLILIIFILIMNKAFGISWKQTLSVIALFAVIALLLGNGLSNLALKSIFKEHLATDEGMAPQIITGDKIASMSFGNKTYVREAIVLLHARDGNIYVRRIVGLPGETVEIKQGKLFINGETKNVPADNKIDLDGGESDFPAAEKDTTTNLTAIKLAGDEYFILSDNSSVGNDSRTFGPLKTSGKDYIKEIIAVKVKGKSIFDKNGIGFSSIK